MVPKRYTSINVQRVLRRVKEGRNGRPRPLALLVTILRGVEAKEAATVLSEIHSAPDKDIPQELWERGRPDGVGPSARATWMSCRSGRGGGGVFQERPDRGRWLVDDR